MAKVHTPQAQAVLDAFNEALEETAKDQYTELDWTVSESVTLELIANTIDRRVEFEKLYAAESDPEVAVKLSCEIRQLDGAVVRMLKGINPEPPAPMNQTQLKNQRAARTRWDREKARNGAGA